MYPIYNIVRNIVSMFVIGYTLGDCIGLFGLLCVCIANQASEAEAYMWPFDVHVRCVVKTYYCTTSLTWRIHESPNTQYIADHVRWRPTAGNAYMPTRDRNTGRIAHFVPGRRHCIGVWIRVYMVIGDAGLRRGLFAIFILVRLGEVSNLVP